MINPMTITIHRGTNQIGGCITEISSSQARIIIDMGDELPSDAQKTDIEIEGVMTKKIIYDLTSSEFYERAVDLSLFSEVGKNDNYNPIDNIFGWGVTYGEIQIDFKTKKLVEYRLLSENNEVQSRAKKIETENLDY